MEEAEEVKQIGIGVEDPIRIAGGQIQEAGYLSRRAGCRENFRYLHQLIDETVMIKIKQAVNQNAGVLHKDEEEQKEASLPHQLRNYVAEMENIEEIYKTEARAKEWRD